LNPSDTVFDSDGNLWIADGDRVIRFAKRGGTLQLTKSAVPDVIIEADAVTLEFDKSGALWVAGDELRRFSPPLASGKTADLVVPMQAGAIAFDAAGNLWVTSATGGCSRVLRFSAPFSAQMKPSVVLGQPDANSCAPSPPGANRIYNASAIAFDNGGNLFVGDSLGNRVLIFRPPFQTFMNASAALGQNSLNSVDALPFDRGGLAFIQSLAFDIHGRLWVAHNGSFVSAYDPPFSLGQQRSYWFDLFNQRSDESGVRVPFAMTVRYGRLRFTPDGFLWFSRGSAKIARLEVPLIGPNGVVHAATFQPGDISPGQIVSAFGIQLGFYGGLSGKIANGRLLAVLGKTGVTINGMLAPVLFANFGQVNFQAPFEATPGQPARVQATIDGFAGPPVFAPIAAVAPEAFTIDGNFAAVLNTEGRVGALSRGKFGILFATGLGRISGDGAVTSAVTPDDALFRVEMPVSVLLGAVECNVLFAGLSPGFVGLYQINFEVPAALGAGVYELRIRQGGKSSRPVLAPVE